MSINLHNRHFLKLLDFTPDEITYILDLAAKLKKAKHKGTEKQHLKGKILHLFLKRLQQEHVAPLKLQHMTRELM
jgi:ornithine carbamoyltransferase